MLNVRRCDEPSAHADNYQISLDRAMHCCRGMSGRAHDVRHVTQYEKWDTLFFVLYPASSLVQALRGYHVYRDNHFGMQAREAEQDHTEPAVRCKV